MAFLHETSTVDLKQARTQDDANCRLALRVKLLAEYALAALLLLVTMPVLLVSLLAVRLTSRGPVFYSQKRLGLHGEVFTIYKIRSMYVDSEPEGARWCVPGDPRVTPVGWLLRCMHIDELPQLINILQGTMSLVGPRPERPEIVKELERTLPEYRRRLAVRPGLTGLAQVLQPPDTSLSMVRSKLAFDLHYIDEWSLWLDFRIIAATLPHILAVPPDEIARFFRFPAQSLLSNSTSPATMPLCLVAVNELTQLGDA